MSLRCGTLRIVCNSDNLSRSFRHGSGDNKCFGHGVPAFGVHSELPSDRKAFEELCNKLSGGKSGPRRWIEVLVGARNRLTEVLQ